MTLPTYPIIEVHQEVMTTFLDNDLGLKLRSVEVLDKKWSPAINEESWKFQFSAPNSENVLEVSLLYPSYRICSLYFLKGDKYFSFQNYLMHIGSNELVKHFDKLRNTDSSNVGAWGLSDNLAIMKKHLKGGLRKVALGREWIEVPLDWKNIGK